MYHYTDGGLKNVWLANGYSLRQSPHGDGVVIHDLDGLTRAICLALTGKGAVLSGVEFRYLRTSMLLSQPALGKLMGVDGQSVARWEKTGRVPKWADKLVRLLYVSHTDGDAPIRRVMERLRAVERLVRQRIVLRESSRGWKPTVEAEEAEEAETA